MTALTYLSRCTYSSRIKFNTHKIEACTALIALHVYTVEPPNKGHVGDNINSAVVSFVERLSSFGCSKCIGKQILGTFFVEGSNILCPYFGGSMHYI